jgi:hypothetical protein
MSDSVTIVIPTIDRVDNVDRVVRNINDVTEDCQIMIVFNKAYCLPMEGKIKELFDEFDNVEYMAGPMSRPDIGDYAKKINLALRYCCTDWLFTGADDLKFHPQWLEKALEVAGEEINVIGTQDLGNPRVIAGEHATHFLVRTDYARNYGTVASLEPGQIFFPGYWHEYMDDELVAFARAKGMFAFAEESIVEHLHPFWGKAPSDRTYEQFKMRMAYGKNVFDKRKHLFIGGINP